MAWATAILACALGASPQAATPPAATPPAATPPTATPPAATPLPAVVLPRPVDVRARLLSGGTFSGKAERWDGTTLTGSFGTRHWNELVAFDLKRVFESVMPDKQNGAQWLVLGELLASSPDGAQLAGDIFNRAKTLGQSDGAIADARARAAAAVQERKQQEQAEKARRLQGGRSGGGAGGAGAGGATAAPTPWPTLTAADQELARSQVKTAARSALDVVGARGNLVESNYFVLAGELTPELQKRILSDLEGCCNRAMRVLGYPADANPFWGKALVLVFPSEEAFTLAEASVFNARVQKGQRAALHTDGPRVTISCWRGNEDRAFTTALMQQMTLGLLYRTVSAAPLPEWAAEGFALWSAKIPEPNAHVDQEWRGQGLQFLRQGGNAADVMGWSVAAGTWPGANGIGNSVGFLLVDLLLGEAPAKFGPWVKAIKGGAPWQQALKDVYGTDSARLAASASVWYRTNDGAPRR